jgi:Protein of unknown function (DUF2442)
MAMKPSPFRRIARIEVLPRYRIHVWWTGGGEAVADFSQEIFNGPAWAPIRDESQFNRVELIENGRVIAWPEPVDQRGFPTLDVDADGLWHMAQEQAAAAKAAAE